MERRSTCSSSTPSGSAPPVATAAWRPPACRSASGTQWTSSGFDKAASLYRTYGEAIDLIEKLVTEEGIDCHFARPGKLILASKPAHVQGFEKTAELLNTRLGVETHLVPKSELRREIGSDAFHGGMVDSKSASLHVGKYIRGLGEAAERAGVTIHEKAPVQKLTKVGSGHELETPRGRIQADQVLLATGAYTRRPFRWHQVRIAPVGSFIIATEPLDASVCDDLLPTRRVASDSKNLLNYFRITPDNRLLFGGRARFAMSNPQSDEKSGKLLRDAMVHVFPQLSDAKVDYCWGGLVDMTLDRMVKAGQHDGVYYSMGYAGHGVQMATYMGRQMAEYMSGVPEANIWRDFEFRRIPGHFGPPWFLPVAGAYYKFKDRVS